MQKSMDLASIFPRTFSLFEKQEAQDLTTRFLTEWGMGHLHFFPMYLRQSRYSSMAVEASDFEYQLHALANQDLIFRKPQMTEMLVLNPSCQFLRLQEASRLLGRSPGLYVLWKSGEQVAEKILSLNEAAILDRMREDLPLYRNELSAPEARIVSDLLMMDIVWAGPSQNQLISPAPPYS
jgi:hypothetical protein